MHVWNLHPCMQGGCGVNQTEEGKEKRSSGADKCVTLKCTFMTSNKHKTGY